VTLRIALEDAREVGLFRWNPASGKWVAGSWKPSRRGLEALLDRPGLYALLRDRRPPRLRPARLSRRRRFVDGRWERILVVPVEEEGSGIETDSIRVAIGGRPAPVYWDRVEEKLVVLHLPDSIMGVRPVSVRLRDRCGNGTTWHGRVDLATADGPGGPGRRR